MKKAFDMIGSNTPQDVKDAWMEAAKDVNANGHGNKGKWNVEPCIADDGTKAE